MFLLLKRFSRDVRDVATLQSVSHMGKYTIAQGHLAQISDVPIYPNMPDTPEIEAYIKNLNAEKARLEGEKQALIEEFTKSIPEEWSPEDLKGKLRDLLAKSYARISQTIDDDEEKALAFQAAKYVMGIGIGQVKITDANSPDKEFVELLKGLQKNDKPTPRTDPLPSSGEDTAER